MSAHRRVIGCKCENCRDYSWKENLIVGTITAASCVALILLIAKALGV